MHHHEISKYKGIPGNFHLFHNVERNIHYGETLKHFIFSISSLVLRLHSLICVCMKVAVTLYPMLVSISRVTDNKHHPSDVLAGALLGVSLALMSLYRMSVSGCR